MKFRTALASAAAFAAVLAALPAAATVILPVNMAFQSGATFSGSVSFADDYSQVTGVTGNLHGYSYGGGYDGVSDDLISWVWNPGSNFASGPSTFGTFLMDGPAGVYSYGSGGYTHWVTFTYDYSAAPTLTFSAAGYGNNVNYDDPMVRGAFGAVPEPATWAMMLLGFGAIGATLRGQRRTVVQAI